MTRSKSQIVRIAQFLKRLKRDRDGLALLEFAFTLPLVLAVGCWGIELSSLALCNLKVSQYALNLADNASRLGQGQNGGVTNLREVDINNALQGANLQGQGIKLTTYGRITISSLENVQQSYDTSRKQRIHWQRCIGSMRGTGYDTSYPSSAPYVSASAGSDSTIANAGVDAVSGIGATGSQVNAPNDTGLIFVEINYLYKPIFGTIYLGSTPRIIHYVASYIVRDNRSFAQIYNPTPTVLPSYCS